MNLYQGMNLYILCKTLLHLRPRQLLYQLKYRLWRPAYIQEVAPIGFRKLDCAAFPAKAKCVEGEEYTFLNITDTFTSWNDTCHGALWGYNLNYMDGLCQEGMSYEEGAEWIERFIRDLPDSRIGLDPYPIALREINWIKFHHVCMNILNYRHQFFIILLCQPVQSINLFNSVMRHIGYIIHCYQIFSIMIFYFVKRF